MVKILNDKKLREKFSQKSIEIANEHDFEKTLDKFMNMKRERICKKDPGYQAFKEKIEQQIKEEQKFYDEIMEKLS